MYPLYHSIWDEKFDLELKPFTYRYSQPSEHRYSIDSVELCWKLGRILNQRDDNNKIRLLDVCAGCGVMGFEVAHWCSRVDSVYFVEVQDAYEQHFMANLEITGRPAEHFKFYRENYCNLHEISELKEWADVLVCNPPYFRPESGSLGKSTFRNRCHYMMDSDFEQLCSAVLYCMRPQAEAYLLLKNLQSQGIDQLAELRRHLSSAVLARKVGEVRGIDVIGVFKL